MSLAGGCTHHVPLCTDVGSRPKDHQQTDAVGQLKEMVQIPVPAEIELARRLLVVAPGDVTSAWIKRQYYPNTHSGYLSAALVNIHQSRGQPTLHRLYRQSWCTRWNEHIKHNLSINVCPDFSVYNSVLDVININISKSGRFESSCGLMACHKMCVWGFFYLGLYRWCTHTSQWIFFVPFGVFAALQAATKYFDYRLTCWLPSHTGVGNNQYTCILWSVTLYWF